MKVDNAEFGLLTAITIFSERKNLKQRKRVEKIQEIYVDALRSYVMSHRKKDPIVAFAKLLGALVELRSLGNLNSRTCFDLKLVNRRLPDFLAEIWDINGHSTKGYVIYSKWEFLKDSIKSNFKWKPIVLIYFVPLLFYFQR